ncbi:MAG TPA: hypothetical protein VGP85_06665 [Pyrinomonadaceae bacterium]|nr:hypothetical protein [Pyrinomonadaceae bacterium]
MKENGEADITLFTDLQLFAKGQWSAAADPSKGIPLKITGGIVDGSATCSGTPFLSADGKSPSKLNIQATDLEENLIKMPPVARPRRSSSQVVGIILPAL